VAADLLRHLAEEASPEKARPLTSHVAQPLAVRAAPDRHPHANPKGRPCGRPTQAAYERVAGLAAPGLSSHRRVRAGGKRQLETPSVGSCRIFRPSQDKLCPLVTCASCPRTLSRQPAISFSVKEKGGWFSLSLDAAHLELPRGKSWRWRKMRLTDLCNRHSTRAPASLLESRCPYFLLSALRPERGLKGAGYPYRLWSLRPWAACNHGWHFA